ncbi:MAG: phage holin, LLH family [Anaerosomatales bacterium]|nr:phage holin, LLH family [Anaerosomatales bacterium]
MDWNGVLFEPLLNAAVVFVVGILVALTPVVHRAITNYAAKMVAQTDTQVEMLLLQISRQAVHMAQQLGADNEEKLALAVAALQREAAEYGLDLTRERATQLVEAAYAMVTGALEAAGEGLGE